MARHGQDCPVAGHSGTERNPVHKIEEQQDSRRSAVSPAVYGSNMNLTTAYVPGVPTSGAGQSATRQLPEAPSPDITHSREQVADCAELRRLLQRSCPGAPAESADVAAMVAICFSGGDASRLVV